MSIKIYSIDNDEVIDSKFLTGKTTYEFAIQNLYPLIDKLNIQRKLQNPSFYRRLREDILKGCIMPPLTLALIMDKGGFPDNIQEGEKYIFKNIQKAFVLDGIQRLNALHTTYAKPEIQLPFPNNRPLFLNVLICRSMDNLLYRMITLNNGQRPMTANHQIEILLANVYDFDDLEIVIQTEKEKGKKGNYQHSFDKSNIIKSYLAFISDSVAIDNKKIIESKLNDLITKKIRESNITEDELEFSEIISFINRVSESKFIKKWFDNSNNIIGFSVGIKNSFERIRDIEVGEFEDEIKEFESAFSALNLSTIKLSKERRNLSKHYFKNYSQLKGNHHMDLLENFMEEVL